MLEIGEQFRTAFSCRDAAAERARLFAAREELKQIAVQSEREGALTPTERAMIHNVVDFRNVRARDVMVPLGDASTVRPETSVDEVLETQQNERRRSLPGHFGGGRGHRTGQRARYSVRSSDRAGSLAHYMRRIVTATEDEPAYRMIRRLRAARLGLAAVVDSEQ